MNSGSEAFRTRGWKRFEFDPTLFAWVRSALPAARAAVASPENVKWLRYGGTWFVGVNALPNDGEGAIAGGPALAGLAASFARSLAGEERLALDRAQVSVCYPGYPKPMAGESEAQFRFRRDRDAAHVDGLMAEGPMRRRYLREPHAFILGIPMSQSGPGASPLVVWEGSHRIMGEMFAAAFEGQPPGRWPMIDVTGPYAAARQEAFERCRRVEVEARPGEAYVLHRHALHGVAPWAEGAEAGPDGRMVAYFRPPMADLRAWLSG